jgi:hypothetical protein
MPENFLSEQSTKGTELGTFPWIFYYRMQNAAPPDSNIMSINMPGQMGSDFNTKQNFGCENFTRHLYILKEHHSMKCSKVLYLVWAVTYSSIWYCRILCLSTVTCLSLRKLVFSNFLDWVQKALRLNLDDWSFNGAFPLENATSLNKQFVPFVDGNFCWWFTSKLHTKPPLIYNNRFWFMLLYDIQIEMRCHFSQLQY